MQEKKRLVKFTAKKRQTAHIPKTIKLQSIASTRNKTKAACFFFFHLSGTLMQRSPCRPLKGRAGAALLESPCQETKKSGVSRQAACERRRGRPRGRLNKKVLPVRPAANTGSLHQHAAVIRAKKRPGLFFGARVRASGGRSTYSCWSACASSSVVADAPSLSPAPVSACGSFGTAVALLR